MKPVGKVFDIFGPVSSPYAAVKPSVREPERFVGKRLYVSPRREEGRRKE
jgi:RNA-binding protein